MPSAGDAVLVVVSEGVGADDLAAAAGDRADVRILGYQPAEELGDVLASADVLVAVLEPDAAHFSVPSKVLSYLSVGRPIIALVPDGNPSAADVTAGGGFVAPPTAAGAADAAHWLSEVTAQSSRLDSIGERARNLAADRFDIGRNSSLFESILTAAASGGPQRSGEPAAVVGSGTPGGVV